MLGRLPTGPDAIAFRGTLFRVSELCWIKAVRLSIPEIIVRVLLFILGLVWVFAMKDAKGGSYYNVEFLLAGFPLALAWFMSGSLKIGCSGDFEDSYETRHGIRSSLFRGWIDDLKNREAAWVHISGSSYDMLFNPHRLAWIRPCIQWSLFPLIVAAVFFGYARVLQLDLEWIKAGEYPVIDDFQILIFDQGTGTIESLCYAIVLASLIGFALSLKKSVEICGTGGVQDIFPMSGADQRQLLELMAGGTSKSSPAKRPSPPPAKETPKPSPAPPTSPPKPAKAQEAKKPPQEKAPIKADQPPASSESKVEAKTSSDD